MTLVFVKLNEDWNAEPNAPDTHVEISEDQVALHFLLNPFAYEAEEGEAGVLTFTQSKMWRLGSTNDEGWYRGQCRYSRSAPAWGEFYELIGTDELEPLPQDWQFPDEIGNGTRHFLFYLRDYTFECIAENYEFRRIAAADEYN